MLLLVLLLVLRQALWCWHSIMGWWAHQNTSHLLLLLALRQALRQRSHSVRCSWFGEPTTRGRWMALIHLQGSTVASRTGAVGGCHCRGTWFQKCVVGPNRCPICFMLLVALPHIHHTVLAHHTLTTLTNGDPVDRAVALAAATVAWPLVIAMCVT